MKTPASVIQHPTASEYFFVEGCLITEWWNTAMDPAVSLARARVEPGVTTRWHRLRGVTERYLILEGQGRVEVGDLPPEAVGPGAVVLIPPGTRQRIANTGGVDLIFLALCTPRFTPAGYEDVESVRI
jgi:mannose-6-phosphate isomerase-like protein (cupin superfamily)